MARDNVLEGVFAINKPMGMSSAQVIRDCQTYFNPSNFFQPLIQKEVNARLRETNAQQRRRSKAKRDMRVKMGHGGTLDPLATGILILGVGRGTKELNQFLMCTKTYETVVLFGASTDTYDRVGRVLTRRAYEDISRDKVEAALHAFKGTFRQMPPLYSALKMNGKPLYEYAREGLEIPREIETREVTVSDIELVEWYDPGTHNHRWPVEEAGVAEQSLAEKVWRMEKEQEDGGAPKRSPEEEQSAREAREAHEAYKRRAEAKQDQLVFDRPAKKRRGPDGRPEPVMSGALGDLPASPYHDNTIRDQIREHQAAADAVASALAGAPAPAPEPAPAPTKGKKNKDRAAPMQAHSNRGANLIPPPPSPDTPPPWSGKGPPACKVRLTVSSGFYVRSFCHDLGEKLGSVAMMAELARTQQADFRVGSANMLAYEDISQGEAVWAPKVERLLRLWQDHAVAQGADPSYAPPTAVVPEAVPEALTAETTKAEPVQADPEAETTKAEPVQAETAETAKAEDEESEWGGCEEQGKPDAS